MNKELPFSSSTPPLHLTEHFSEPGAKVLGSELQGKLSVRGIHPPTSRSPLPIASSQYGSTSMMSEETDCELPSKQNWSRDRPVTLLWNSLALPMPSNTHLSADSE